MVVWVVVCLSGGVVVCLSGSLIKITIRFLQLQEFWCYPESGFLTAAKLKGDSSGDSHTYDIAELFVGKSQALGFDLLAARSGLSIV